MWLVAGYLSERMVLIGCLAGCLCLRVLVCVWLVGGWYLGLYDI